MVSIYIVADVIFMILHKVHISAFTEKISVSWPVILIWNLYKNIRFKLDVFLQVKQFTHIKRCGQLLSTIDVSFDFVSCLLCRDNFLKELALWAKLRHPNIVQFLGVLKHPDRLIFVTEYLRNVRAAQ